MSLQEQRHKDRSKNRIKNILDFNPALARPQIVKRLRSKKRNQFPSSKEDAAVQNMIKALSKTRDKRIRSKVRSSSSYHNRNQIRGKAASVMRNTRSRQNNSNKVKTRMSTAKNKLIIRDVESQNITLKDLECHLPKLYPFSNQIHSKHRKSRKYDSGTFEKNDELRNNQK